MPLTRERIVQAALAEVEADGVAALSMRKVGQRLGREAMSLYHHFPSKQHLLDAMIDHMLLTTREPPEELPPIEKLRFVMYEFRATANRFPALYPLRAVHRLNTPVGVRYIESILRLVRSVVPSDELAARTFRTVGYFLTGASLDETAGYAKGPSAAEPVSGEFIQRECPTLASAAPYFQAEHWDRTFALGVDALLSALQREVDVLAAGAPHARP
ncbi:MAG: TetR/AcrR family transcriptional regulator C-terminal domain-containing protein [Proteobacteria bacterium]|nr:TetR/AcrR family transcriptional regulator C-terminal domain-containing protein [Pseudomonadota bacterium]